MLVPYVLCVEFYSLPSVWFCETIMWISFVGGPPHYINGIRASIVWLWSHHSAALRGIRTSIAWFWMQPCVDSSSIKASIVLLLCNYEYSPLLYLVVLEMVTMLGVEKSHRGEDNFS